MSKLKTSFLGVIMKNPVVVASGTYGYGNEYVDYYDPSELGGISGKGITLNKKSGNEGIRIYETPSGLMNSIGLENPGIDEFIQVHLKEMMKIKTTKIINVGGNTSEEYIKAIEKINSLLLEDKTILKERIRSVAIKFRNYEIAENIYKKIYNTSYEK